MVDAQVQVEMIKQSKKIPADKRAYHGIEVKSSSPLPTFDETGHPEGDEDDNCGEMDDEPMHLGNSDDNQAYNFSEDNQVDIKPTVKRASLRRRPDMKKDNEPPVIDSEEGDNLENSGEGEDEEFKPEVCKSSNKVGSKLVTKRLLLRPRKNSKKIDKDKPPEDKEDEDKWSEDNDDEYNPEQPGNESLSNRAQIKK